jgi:hypothetical protein
MRSALRPCLLAVQYRTLYEEEDMAEALEIGPDKVLFQDDFITVTIPHFDTKSGRTEVLVEHKRTPAGDYYIWVHFKSGDSSRMDYNSANPNNPRPWIINSSHRNDTITALEAKKIR